MSYLKPRKGAAHSGGAAKHKARKRSYERINFLPFADAMFSGVAIVIIIFMNYGHKHVQEINRPQADFILRCEGASAYEYSVLFLKSGSEKGLAAEKRVGNDEIENEIREKLRRWPELSARLLVQQNPGNRQCTADLKQKLDRLRGNMIKEGRSGMALPLYSIVFQDDSGNRAGER